MEKVQATCFPHGRDCQKMETFVVIFIRARREINSMEVRFKKIFQNKSRQSRQSTIAAEQLIRNPNVGQPRADAVVQKQKEKFRNPNLRPIRADKESAGGSPSSSQTVNYATRLRC
jgi:hypothetical protein